MRLPSFPELSPQGILHHFHGHRESGWVSSPSLGEVGFASASSSYGLGHSGCYAACVDSLLHGSVAGLDDESAIVL